MFKKLRKNKKAQQTAEYALLISLVVAAVIAMQTYAQRTIQARIRDASQFLVMQSSAGLNGMGNTQQYEPYYLDTQYEITRGETSTETQDTFGYSKDSSTDRTRKKGGRQISTYNGLTTP